MEMNEKKKTLSKQTLNIGSTKDLELTIFLLKYIYVNVCAIFVVVRVKRTLRFCNCVLFSVFIVNSAVVLH